jgi:putative ABC transport system ATP-binding protein/macrolide transport system ATP-binding/permease protein
LPSDEPIAYVRALEKRYATGIGEIRALDGVSADFGVGRITAVAGPSGSGKSTMLRLLAGIDRPSAGQVVVDGLPLHRARQRALRRLRRTTVGYVFQRPSDNLFPTRTVGDQLLAAARGPRAGATEARSVAEALGIRDRLDHLPSALSGGEQQRAAIARMLCAGARIVVADEPTAQLDDAASRAVLDAIAALRDRGVAFVLASHDETVLARADEVVRLDHGALAPAGRPGDLGMDPTDRLASLEDVRPALAVRGVDKTFRRGDERIHAVRDATLELGVGRIGALVGRSGSGKTTLLNVAAGWERPDRGEILLRGQMAPAVPAWREISVLPQKLGLLAELTIRENIEHPARFAGLLDGVSERIEELVEELGLAHLQARLPSNTSIGEQQRAALARAMVLSPDVILVDEPTSHQDRGSARAVLELLRRAANEGTAVLVATHDATILRAVDETWQIDDGVLTKPEA